MKQHMENRKYAAAIAIGLLLIFVLLFCLLHKPSVRSYQAENPTPFDVIADYFTENPLEKPVLAHRNNILRYGWNDVWANERLPQEVKDAIIDIFLSSRCTGIYISMWDNELDYCSFYDSGEKVESGIAFLAGPQKERELLGARMVRECFSISDNWVYYEAYTPLGEKDFQY